jgi:hypothetical protein
MKSTTLGIISLFAVLAVAIGLSGFAEAAIPGSGNDLSNVVAQPLATAKMAKASDSGNNLSNVVAQPLTGLKLSASTLPDLTGTYHGDDHGVYYVREIGNNIYWYGQEADQYGNAKSNPSWSNIAFGTINGNAITLNWADVPNGKTSNSGTLTLTASHTGDPGHDQTYVLQVTQQTGGFGGTRLDMGIPA